MKIIIITREKLESLPPLYSLINILNDFKIDLEVICCGASEKIDNDLANRGIVRYYIDYHFDNDFFKIKKLISSIKFRYLVLNHLKHSQFDLILVEGQGAFRILGRAISSYKYYLYILEMYLGYEKEIRRIIYGAEKIIMPQYDRAVFYQINYGLEKRPFVLPNKPYFYLEENELLVLEEKYKETLEKFKKHKVILYQGIIHPERDLTTFIKAIKSLGHEYLLVLVGKDQGMLAQYKEIDPDIMHIPFIPAPDYLIYTMNSYIGILTYDSRSLNCAYCAPNKIYEYAKYALPMIGNDIPGLVNTIKQQGFGEIVDENSENSICSAILRINSNYETYSRNARKFYDNTDNVQTVKNIFGLN